MEKYLKRERFNIYLLKEQKKLLMDLSEEFDMSINDIIRTILVENLPLFIKQQRSYLQEINKIKEKSSI